MNKNEYLSSIPLQAEAFAISELFNNTDNSILYISKDDREIFDIKEKISWILLDKLEAQGYNIVLAKQELTQPKRGWFN